MSVSTTKNFEYELNEHGLLVFTNMGTSMMPLIRQNRDLLEIVPKGELRCKKYDVVLYKRNGKYILHRILQVRKSDYVIVGDHQYRKEHGVKDEQIIGILQAVVRDGKRIPVTDPQYKMYVHLWCDLYYLRAGLLFSKTIPERVRRLVKEKSN